MTNRFCYNISNTIDSLNLIEALEILKSFNTIYRYVIDNKISKESMLRLLDDVIDSLHENEEEMANDYIEDQIYCYQTSINALNNEQNMG